MVARMAVAAAPDEGMPALCLQVVLHAEVRDVHAQAQVALEARGLALGLVDVGQQLQLVAGGQAVGPAREQVVARDLLARQRRRLVAAPLVGVALQREPLAGRAPVGTKAELLAVPAVLRAHTVGAARGRAFDATCVQPHMAALAELGAMAHRGIALAAACAQHGQRALRGLGAARGDVDDAVDGVRAPQRATWPADHLDAVHVLEQDVLRVPQHAGIQGRVEDASVQQHEHLVARVVQAACRDHVVARRALGHIQVGRQPQCVGQGACAGAADLVGADHEDRGRGILQALAAPGHGADADGAQLLERQVGDVVVRTGLRHGAARPQGGDGHRCGSRGLLAFQQSNAPPVANPLVF